MPPPRVRAPDDARSEVSTGKERHATTHPAGISKSKRPAGAGAASTTTNHRDAKVVPLPESASLAGHDPSTAHTGGVSPPSPTPHFFPSFEGKLTRRATAQIDWASLPTRALHAYRHAHRLAAPAAFASAHNRLVLADPAGLGARSPTMAGRAGGSGAARRGRAPKEVLAQAVRRDCNAAPVNETEAIAAFLYRVKNQSEFAAGVMGDVLMQRRQGVSGAFSDAEDEGMTSVELVLCH